MSAAFAGFDVLTMAGSWKLTSTIGTKYVGPAVGKLFSATAGKIVGGVGTKALGVVSAGITGFDVGSKLIDWLDNYGTINEDIENLVKILDYISKSSSANFKQLIDKVIKQISGSSYALGKIAEQLKNTDIPKMSNKITKESIDKSTTVLKLIISFIKEFESLGEGLDILKKKETRDLYIKESESWAGALGRGVDWIPRNLSTAFGLLGEGDMSGENVAGFTNMYNHLMTKVSNLEIKVGNLFKSISPIIESFQKYKEYTDSVRESVIAVNEEIKLDPSLESFVK